MEINTARKTLTQMQGCFQGLDLPIMGEYEKLDLEAPSVHMAFRSCVLDADCLGEVLAFLWLNHGVIQLSINFNEQLNESILDNLLGLINTINLLNSGIYCVLQPKEGKIEFRTAYVLRRDKFDEDQFRSVLKNLLELALHYYTGLRQLIRNEEITTCLSH